MRFQRTAVSIAATQAALLWGGLALAQTAPAPKEAEKIETVVVSGKRAALQSAQKIKQASDEIVDSIVASDIGALPDRSVTEVLQRIVGVTIDRTMAKGDPEHYSVEGSGVTIRGLTYVRSELNGRDSFSANGGRALNFEDVPPELMAGVDVYKNPSAEQIEGSIGGLVNLRTALPFDYAGFKASLSAKNTYSTLKGKSRPEYSGLLSNTWNTPAGKIGMLLSLATSKSGTRTDAFQVEPYYPRNDAVAGQTGTYWVPKGSQWRTLEFDRKRDGTYAAVQWKKDNMESSLTFFQSKYKMQWDENAIFAQTAGHNTLVKDGQWDGNGALVYGTLSLKDGVPLDFGADTRTATRNSQTRDVGWNFSYKPSAEWTLKSDLQFITAKTNSFDSTVATGAQMAKETIDLRGSIPSLIFDAADKAALANPANYYWAFTMEHLDRGKATEKAWKGDAKYNFTDHSFLQDLRFGVRIAERDAETTNSNPGYHWAAVTQPWQVGWNISGLARLSDKRFSGDTYTHEFKNFFNGKATVPSLIMPTLETATGFPGSYAKLQGYHDILCAEQVAAQGWGSCDKWAPATLGVDPASTNLQKESNRAAYAQLRFGVDEMNIDGNVGLRLVRTEATAHGSTVYTGTPVPPNTTGIKVPVIADFSETKDYTNTYTNALPSLNLRWKANSELQFRFALGTGISRPDFSQLQAQTTLNQGFEGTTNQTTGVTNVTGVTRSGSAAGNPLLKPIRSNQIDLTSEWYFSRTGSLTGAVFHKQLKDVIIGQTSIIGLPDSTKTTQEFVVTSPINGAKGTASGLELAFQTYFDMLPGAFSGLGVQANYTYVNSKTKLYTPVNQVYCTGGNSAANVNLNLNGCDLDGRTFGNLPLQNLSKNAFNLALMYDQGPISARIAYSWRSKFLQNVNVNGTQGGDGLDTNPSSPTKGQNNVAWALPTWADGYGQLDAGLFYKFDDKLTVGLEGTNLTDSLYRQLMQQHIGFKTRAVFASGPRYTMMVRYSF